MTDQSNPCDEKLRALLDGALAEEERVEIEALLEGDPECLLRLETITGYVAFRDRTLSSTPGRNPQHGERLIDLIGKLKAGDFSRPTDEAEALEALDGLPADGESGRLGNYEIIDVIACGGMGIVFRAHDPDLERLVAIKALAPRFAQDSEARERFLKEARMVAALDHPNILPIYTVAEGVKVPYFVMRLVEGETLADLVARDGPLPRKRALRMMLQVARALAAAHSKEVIHRDLKPANLLIERGGEHVWVADFGIAKRGETSGEISGTPGFGAPEQLSGAAPTIQSDLYGLGGCMHFALTGEPPGMAGGEGKPEKILAQLLREDPAARPRSADEVGAVLKRMIRPPLVRRIALAAIGLLAVIVTIAAVTPLGLTGWTNRGLGALKGEAFFLKGKLGTYPSLQAAIDGSRDGESLLVDFDGERELAPTIATKSLTIRAAPGRRPIFVQSETSAGMLRLTAPTVLEGLMFVRPPGPNRPPPLLAAINSKLTLRDCAIIALEGETSPTIGPLFTSGVPDVEIRDCVILTGSSRWYNLNANMGPGNQLRGSLRLSNSFISAERGPILVCQNIDLDIELENVTCLGSDLLVPRIRRGKLTFDVSQSILASEISVIWLYEDHPEAARDLLTWNGSGNVFPTPSPGFLRFADDTFAQAETLDRITEDSPGGIALGGQWYGGDSLEVVRSEWADWLKEARPVLGRFPGKGADLDLIEEFVEKR